MIIVLSKGYEVGTDELLDVLNRWKVFTSLDSISVEYGKNKIATNRKIKKLKEDRLLISHRYRGNNIIYMIGNDAKENWNKWEAHQIAVYRQYPNLTEEEAELASPFEDNVNNIVYWNKINKLMKAKMIPIDSDFIRYVDELWKEYKNDTRRN